MDPTCLLDCYVPSSERWRTLGIFSILTLINSTICFSLAPIAHSTHEVYGPRTTSIFTFVFLAIFSVTCVPASALCSQLGLRRSILVGGALQAIGSIGRAVFYFNFHFTLLGQAVAAMGQGFLINTAPELSLVWFPSSERVVATTIGINANTLGVAFAFVVGPAVVGMAEFALGHPMMAKEILILVDGVVAGLAVLVLVVAVCMLSEGPATPPSKAAVLRMISTAESKSRRQLGVFEHIRKDVSSLYRGVKNLTLTNDQKFINPKINFDFWIIVISFWLSECFINCLSTDMSALVVNRGVMRSKVGLSGFCFILSCILGSAVVGPLADRTKKYKMLLMVCMALTGFFCFIFGFVPIGVGSDANHLIFIIFSIGFFVGPIQALAIETAVDVAYPYLDESMTTAIVQLIGTSASALVLPLFDLVVGWRWLGFAMTIFVFGVFCCLSLFKEKYRRMRAEMGEDIFSLERD